MFVLVPVDSLILSGWFNIFSVGVWWEFFLLYVPSLFRVLLRPSFQFIDSRLPCVFNDWLSSVRSFPSSETPDILKLDLPGSVLHVFFLLPHELFLFIALEITFSFDLPGH